MRAMEPLYLSGLTAAGKTAVGLRLADALPVEVEFINADAYQHYCGMEIISAAPSADEKARYPHHRFSVTQPTASCDANHFAEQTHLAISAVQARGALPIVIGGSGLYVKAITHGIGDVPPSDPALRAQLAQRDLESLVAELRQLDPRGAEQTDLKNRRYVSRKLEICLLTGQSASALSGGWKNDDPDILGFVLLREREELVPRIDQRVLEMFAMGAVEEVTKLPEQLSETAAKAIGLREIRAHLAGELTRAECIERIQIATRQYAKRQRTWFRRETCFTPINLTLLKSEDEAVSQIVKTWHARCGA